MGTGKGIPLIEEVITPLMLDETVGIVKPTLAKADPKPKLIED